jgi:hypothetical protein
MHPASSAFVHVRQWEGLHAQQAAAETALLELHSSPAIWQYPPHFGDGLSP